MDGSSSGLCFGMHLMEHGITCSVRRGHAAIAVGYTRGDGGGLVACSKPAALLQMDGFMVEVVLMLTVHAWCFSPCQSKNGCCMLHHSSIGIAVRLVMPWSTPICARWKHVHGSSI